MELQTFSHADYLDILYDNRNKQYGGYELRKNYHLRMKKAGLSVALLCTLLCSYALWPKHDLITVTAPFINRPIEITHLNIPHQPLHIEPPKPAPAPPAVKPTIAHTPPKIVSDDLVKDPPKTVDDLKGKEPGPIDAKGDPGGTVAATSTNTTGTGTGTTTVTPPTPPAPVKWAEEMPLFNGDMSAFLQRNLNYPYAAKENNIEGSVVIQFVVNEDGTVTEARVIKGIGGGCNEEALRVVRSMPKWKPGKQNGHAVKVFYTLPIRFVLE
jgi:periplasmic protein TonB